MILAKAHVVNGKKLVAVCDAELLGKKFEEKDFQLDLTSNFYKGKQTNEENLMQLLEGAYVVNLVGKESVEFGIKKGLIQKESVKTVAKVPHSELFEVDL